MPQEEKVKVKLPANHTHAGVDYEAGETIECTPPQAEWIKKNVKPQEKANG